MGKIFEEALSRTEEVSIRLQRANEKYTFQATQTTSKEDVWIPGKL